MGLFDGYQFDPGAFQQQGGGGLLGLIRSMQFQRTPDGAQFPGEQPGATPNYGQSNNVMVGDYSMPMFGGPAQPTEMSAQSRQPQQPQPMQQQPAPTEPATFGTRQGGGFLDQFNSGLQSIGNGGSIIGALTGNLTDPQSVNRTQANQTQQMLVSKGMDPAIAKTIVSDPALLRAVLPQVLGMGGQTDDIKEFQFAQKQGFTGTLEQWMQRKRAGAGEYSLTPQYGTDKDGNTVLIQTGKSGEAIQTKLPEGLRISSGVEKIDLGTSWGLIDKRTGNMVGTQAKDIVGKESAEEVGKGQGLAKLALPQAKTATESAFKVINDLRTHPGIDIGTGLSSKIDPRSLIPGQPGYDFQALNEQAQGKSFMAAREALKGAGQVTDFEGKKGEQAIANLKTAQSKEQYLKALDELERMLKASYEDLQKKAGGSSSAAVAPPAAPPAGFKILKVE